MTRRHSLAAAFGQRLRALRKQRGLTQEELGRATRLDFKFLGAVERGSSAPSFDTIEKLAKALDVNAHDFFVPDPSVSGQLKARLDLLSSDVARLDAAALREFFAALLDAVRRLESQSLKR